MGKSCEKASLLAVHLIEDQLRALPLGIAAVDKVMANGGVAECTLTRKSRPATTGSGGNIVADKAEHPDKVPDDAAFFHLSLKDKPVGQDDYLRVSVGNALVTVGAFLKAHDMLTRTPEVQFLSHAVDAILNANRLDLPEGHMPTAAFDGLVLEAGLDGSPLFPDGDTDGVMAPGDGVALLQWLSRYLRGEKAFVTGGDAG